MSWQTIKRRIGRIRASTYWGVALALFSWSFYSYIQFQYGDLVKEQRALIDNQRQRLADKDSVITQLRESAFNLIGQVKSRDSVIRVSNGIIEHYEGMVNVQINQVETCLGVLEEANRSRRTMIRQLQDSRPHQWTDFDQVDQAHIVPQYNWRSDRGTITLDTPRVAPPRKLDGFWDPQKGSLLPPLPHIPIQVTSLGRRYQLIDTLINGATIRTVRFVE